jgi:hypothetical protein
VLLADPVDPPLETRREHGVLAGALTEVGVAQLGEGLAGGGLPRAATFSASAAMRLAQAASTNLRAKVVVARTIWSRWMTALWRVPLVLEVSLQMVAMQTSV